jgi:hypothetical protein
MNNIIDDHVTILRAHKNYSKTVNKCILIWPIAYTFAKMNYHILCYISIFDPEVKCNEKYINLTVSSEEPGDERKNLVVIRNYVKKLTLNILKNKEKINNNKIYYYPEDITNTAINFKVCLANIIKNAK